MKTAHHTLPFFRRTYTRGVAAGCGAAKHRYINVGQDVTAAALLQGLHRGRTPTLPDLPYSRELMDELALKIIRAQTTLTGVQPKLSLHLDRHEGAERLTIVTPLPST